MYLFISVRKWPVLNDSYKIYNIYKKEIYTNLMLYVDSTLKLKFAIKECVSVSTIFLLNNV